jgi:hypothetical protein
MNGDTVKTALRASIQLVEQAGLQYSLMGALALGVYGRGRATHDVDIMIDASTESLQQLQSLAGSRGFVVDEAWQTYHSDVADVQIRLIFRGVPIDVMLPRDDHDRSAIRRREQRAADGTKIWVMTREDFILQKLKAGRPRDFDDVIPFFAQHRDELDHSYLNEWATQLGIREELDYLWSQSQPT